MPMTSHYKVLYYHFSPEEIYAIYKLILYIGWIPRNDDKVTDAINHICKIVESDGMATRDNQTT
jgi:hypothetical protein